MRRSAPIRVDLALSVPQPPRIGERTRSSSVLTRSSSVLTRSSSVLTRSSSVLTRSSSVLTRSSSVLTRSSSALTRSSSVLTRSSSVLTRSSSVLTRTSSQRPRCPSARPRTTLVQTPSILSPLLPRHHRHPTPAARMRFPAPPPGCAAPDWPGLARTGPVWRPSERLRARVPPTPWADDRPGADNTLSPFRARTSAKSTISPPKVSVSPRRGQNKKRLSGRRDGSASAGAQRMIPLP
jgi:hypothetical protein